jgi:prevent-host-death family protein
VVPTEELAVPRVVNVTEAKAQLSRLLEQARAGERIIIGKAGKPVAVLSAYDADPEPRTLGGWEGEIWIADDFDDPLPDDLQRHFDGREP